MRLNSLLIDFVNIIAITGRVKRAQSRVKRALDKQQKWEMHKTKTAGTKLQAFRTIRDHSDRAGS